MHVAVLPLPSLLPPDSLADRTVVVIDVLRATTTIAHALAAGALEVRVFASLASARAAFDRYAAPKVLAGERACLKPAGFDLGNSPGEMTPDAVANRTVFMSTTNGTRAIQAAFDHPTLMHRTPGRAACYTAALVNRQAIAQQILADGREVALLCAGSDGEVAEEDLIGAGGLLAALDRLGADPSCPDDAGAAGWYERFRGNPVAVLKQTRGGRRLLGAGMAEDIDASARLDLLPVISQVTPSMQIRKIACIPE